ncbi:prepilin-type N-terminal cleavage/methylation domain-containing protein [Synechocystis sp. PCC 7509]|uniref:prepilin-type N-terminal cleavage/methylation domain-containing protein n=1 Tax=Synechocystis sp. PCC 7509 TaxID=927677 RepID=UPI0002ACB1FF|nr:prepilin-type N-terminal cleavage/methylation domain-containing protein [Synechocystis sp. PCC 7509]
MNIKYFIFLLRQLSFNHPKRKISGFTLVELIISMAIASVVVSGLMSLVVQLVSTNQQESGQTQTQNDMQLALDYISNDLREAVYVYPGECLTATGEGSKSAITVSPDFCPGVVNHIKDFGTDFNNNSMPILAFWKLDTLPSPLINSCGTATPTAGVPCNSGRTYTLVVYFLRKNVDTDIPRWYGKSRLLRYELPNYASDGTAIANYVSPEQPGVGFRKWPWQLKGGTVSNLQAAIPNLNNDIPQTLVDFVDGERINSSVADSTACPVDDLTNDVYYRVSPDVTATPFAGVRSFYACVRVDKTSELGVDVYDGRTLNQDVLVFLRGNSIGRVQPGNNNKLPTLRTQVLRRSIVNKDPKAID